MGLRPCGAGGIADELEPVHAYEPAHPLADADGYVAYPVKSASTTEASPTEARWEHERHLAAAESSRLKLQAILYLFG
jgi:flagellar basal body rod protein FlgC